MKNKLLISILVVFAWTASALGQSRVTRTTLSSAMAAGSTTMVVASATGFATTTNGVNNYVLIERDLRRVTGVSGTTITLAQAGGVLVGHPSGATVLFGPTGNWQPATGGSTGVFLQSVPTGTCSRANQAYLPSFVVSSAQPFVSGTADCLNGRWVLGTLPDAGAPQPALLKACSVPIGSVAYGSFGTDTTASTTMEYTINFFVPSTMLATGITNLNGSAVDGASKKIVMLHDMAGNLIANSATAGTAATGNDAFQAIPFTAATYVIGPAWYFMGLQDDTADVAGIRTVASNTFNGVIAGGLTSVFGTVAGITPPTTFTTAQGMIGCLY